MRPTLPIAVALLLASIVLAGCLGDGGPGRRLSGDDDDDDDDGFSDELQETSDQAEVSDKEGAIVGYVMSQQITPIGGANVTIVELNRTTRSALDGSYTLSLVEPGEYRVRAEGHGWKPQVQTVEVEAGLESRLSFELEEIPGVHAYHEVIEYQAFLECGTGFTTTQKPAIEPLRGPANQVADAVEPLPLFGLDGFVDRYVRLLPEEWNETRPGIGLLVNTCGAARIVTDATVGEGYSNDRFLFNWSHEDPSIQDIVIELNWRPAPNAAREFSVTVEPMIPRSECVEDCVDEEDGQTENDTIGYYNFGYDYVRARGGPPLEAHITLEDLERVTRYFNENETKAGADSDETSTGNPVMKPQNFTESAHFVIRIFAVANELGEGPPADYALSFQQSANLYISQFFVKPSDETYTAIPE